MRQRSSYPKPFKAQAVQECLQSGATVSSVAITGSLRSGKRAAAIIGLIQSARMNRHDPYADLKDVLTRLPTQRAIEIGHLPPHQWTPAWLVQGMLPTHLPIIS